MESIVALMMTHPVLSLCFLFVLLLVPIIIFRKVIEQWLIKKFNLYTEKQVKEALFQTMSDGDAENEDVWKSVVIIKWDKLKRLVFFDSILQNLKKIK